jgi:hypothetical protein
MQTTVQVHDLCSLESVEREAMETGDIFLTSDGLLARIEMGGDKKLDLMCWLSGQNAHRYDYWRHAPIPSRVARLKQPSAIRAQPIGAWRTDVPIGAPFGHLVLSSIGIAMGALPKDSEGENPSGSYAVALNDVRGVFHRGDEIAIHCPSWRIDWFDPSGASVLTLSRAEHG